MKEVREGEWIKAKYRVIKRFPFVIGTLYYTEYHLGQEVHTRFVHALDLHLSGKNLNFRSLLERDDQVFFPISEVLVDEDRELLFQVFRHLEGTLLAHYLGKHAPLSLKEAIEFGRKTVRHLLRLYDVGQFTLVHPQNMVLTSARSLRFLYGGERGALPKGLAGSGGENTRVNQMYDSYTVGVFLYQMLTGKNPMAQGLTIPSVSCYRNDCPFELDQFVLRLLSLDINKRPGVEEMADFFDWMTERLERRLGEKNE
ncbi:hypothetical protein [Thermoactinomyces mirandus]|uniref:Protein kinase domain-containing protein n=1 Tax=Thermoactinomyces mirandus TaxID=2756294 RepID=A0A7W1XTJ2_9BACL|nr:hypothetical protein [Thermoactinomyces mirandus]MBA4603012.1 hypothetical protein [Thermoactinomyces mirandus]